MYICSLCASRCAISWFSKSVVFEMERNVHLPHRLAQTWCWHFSVHPSSGLTILKRTCSTSEQEPIVLTLEQRQKRAEFWKKEKKFEAEVEYSALSEKEKLIHKIHRGAIEHGHFTYDDPDTGYKVFTRLRHFLRGSCCGNACRHCIYNHIEVPPGIKKNRKFNSAFWVNVMEAAENSDEKDEE